MSPGWIDPLRRGEDSRAYRGHTWRYIMALGFVRPGDVVVDAACGCGYGSFILADRAKQVYSLEVDERALKVAGRRYAASNVEYRQCDLNVIEELPECDIAVSFETVEHLEDPVRFTQLLKAARRLIILSTPVIKTTHKNHLHLHDFNEKQVRRWFIDEEWALWEQVRQGPYTVVVMYRKVK